MTLKKLLVLEVNSKESRLQRYRVYTPSVRSVFDNYPYLTFRVKPESNFNILPGAAPKLFTGLKYNAIN